MNYTLYDEACWTPCARCWQPDANAGNLIQAIKNLRANLNCGLKDAKEIVEEYIRRRQANAIVTKTTALPNTDDGMTRVVEHYNDGSFAIVTSGKKRYANADALIKAIVAL